MKKIVVTMAAVLLGMVLSGSAAAQAYDPYGYGAYAPDPYAYAQVYDPYYELHQIHYQLYLRPYGYYPYAYFAAPAVPVVVAPPVAAPLRQALRVAPTLVRRR